MMHTRIAFPARPALALLMATLGLALALPSLFGIADFGIAATVAFAQEHELDADEAKAALRDALTKMGKRDLQRLEVREVLSCYPLHGTPKNEYLCLLNMSSQDGSFKVEKLPFRQVASSWEFIPPTGNYLTPSPACPEKSEAEKLLQNSLRDSQLTVVSGDAEGNISAERGMNREKKGPLRLMCTYSTKASLGEKTVVAYFRYRKGEYLIDPDHETWLD